MCAVEVMFMYRVVTVVMTRYEFHVVYICVCS